MRRSGGDPYWTTARFDCVASDGTPVRKGDRIFYYPATRTVKVGQAAKDAAARFEAEKQDEDFMSRGMSWE